MGNIKNLLRAIVAIIVFCLGTYVLFRESRIVMTTLNTTRQMVKDEVIYQQYNIADKGTITYTELISTLLQPLDYDIMINGLIIKRIEHSPEKISEYAIPVRDYIKTYKYDNEGNVILIIYTGKE